MLWQRLWCLSSSCTELIALLSVAAAVTGADGPHCLRPTSLWSQSECMACLQGPRPASTHGLQSVGAELECARRRHAMYTVYATRSSSPSAVRGCHTALVLRRCSRLLGLSLHRHESFCLVVANEPALLVRHCHPVIPTLSGWVERHTH